MASGPRPSRAAVITRLAGYLATVTRAHPVRVAIDGRSAAGKTTLADELAVALARLGRPASRIRIDDFHRPRAERHLRQDRPPWLRYYHDTFDHSAIRATLLPLGPGGDRRYRPACFDLASDTPVDAPLQVAPPGGVILVDGVFLCRPELDDLWDIRIVVAIDAEESLRRGTARDAGYMGTVAVAIERYRTIYIPAEDHYLATVRPQDRAVAVLDNTAPATPRLDLRQEPPTARD